MKQSRGGLIREAEKLLAGDHEQRLEERQRKERMKKESSGYTLV
jgi:hypothetical protein